MKHTLRNSAIAAIVGAAFAAATSFPMDAQAKKNPLKKAVKEVKKGVQKAFGIDKKRIQKEVDKAVDAQVNALGGGEENQAGQQLDAQTGQVEKAEGDLTFRLEKPEAKVADDAAAKVTQDLEKAQGIVTDLQARVDKKINEIEGLRAAVVGQIRGYITPVIDRIFADVVKPIVEKVKAAVEKAVVAELERQEAANKGSVSGIVAGFMKEAVARTLKSIEKKIMGKMRRTIAKKVDYVVDRGAKKAMDRMKAKASKRIKAAVVAAMAKRGVKIDPESLAVQSAPAATPAPAEPAAPAPAPKEEEPAPAPQP